MYKEENDIDEKERTPCDHKRNDSPRQEMIFRMAKDPFMTVIGGDA